MAFSRILGSIQSSLSTSSSQSPRASRNAGVAGAAQPLVLLVDHPDAGVGLGQAVTQGPAPVRGAVVHQDQLKVPLGLGQDGLDALFQIFLYLVTPAQSRWPLA